MTTQKNAGRRPSSSKNGQTGNKAARKDKGNRPDEDDEPVTGSGHDMDIDSDSDADTDPDSNTRIDDNPEGAKRKIPQMHK